MGDPRYFTNTTDRYDDLFEKAGRMHNVDPMLLKMVWYLESGGKPDIHNSTAGAQGPFQFMPKTWESMAPGQDVHDINQAAYAAAKYLRIGLDKTGSVQGALGFYNSGNPNPQGWTNSETSAYIRDAGLNWGNMYKTAAPQADNEQVLNNTMQRLRGQETVPQSKGSDVLMRALQEYHKEQGDQTSKGASPAMPTPPQSRPTTGLDVLKNAYEGYKSDREQNAASDSAKDEKLDQAGGKMSALDAFFHGALNGAVMGYGPEVNRIQSMVLKPGDKEAADKAYQDTLNDQRRAEASHPEAYSWGNLAGNSATFAVPFLGEGAVGSKLGAYLLRGGVGMAEGGLSGYLNNNDPNSVGTDIAKGALAGGALGMAGGAIGDVGSAIVNNPLTRYVGKFIPHGGIVTGTARFLSGVPGAVVRGGAVTGAGNMLTSPVQQPEDQQGYRTD